MTIDEVAIERLVAEAQSGDEWAFGMIFDHFHEPIYRYIASRVHRPSDAESPLGAGSSGWPGTR